MKITYTEVNGRRYAYTCTSERVPGKKNPVSRRVYLGIVNPDTGEIIPKKGLRESDLVIGRGFRVKSYGDAALAMEVARRLNLPEDLEEVFGDRGPRILAVAVAQAVRPSSSDTVHTTLGESYILEPLGIRSDGPDRRWVVDAINSFDYTEATRFFRIRGERTDGRLFLMPLTLSLTSSFSDPLRTLYPQLRSDDVAVAVMADYEGNPIAFEAMDDPSLDPARLIGLMSELKGLGCRPLYVSDTLSAPTVRLMDLVTNGLDFIAPFPRTSVQYRSLIGDRGDVPGGEGGFREDGSYVTEGIVGMRMERDTYMLVPSSDPGFDGCGARLRAFTSYDPDLNRDLVASVNKIAEGVKSRLNGARSEDPEASLRFAVGELSGLFRVTADRDGVMKVSVRRDAMADLRRNFGRALVLTTGSGWEEVARARAVRRDIMDSLHQYYRGSRWVMEYRGRGVRGFNQMFIEFLVVMIYSEIRRTLASEGFEEDVGEALHVASSLKLLVTPAGDIASSVDRGTRKLLRAFGVDIPTRENLEGSRSECSRRDSNPGNELGRLRS